jgi:L-asparaginase/Glu-tRNA(Gln) amidotransferase subunit D
MVLSKEQLGRKHLILKGCDQGAAGLLFVSFGLGVGAKEAVDEDVRQVARKGVAVVESAEEHFEVLGQHHEVKRHLEV